MPKLSLPAEAALAASAAAAGIAGSATALRSPAVMRRLNGGPRVD